MKAEFDTDYKYMGCRITYQGNILICSHQKTTEENYRTAINALNLLIGHPISDEEFKLNKGRIEVFKSYGYGES